MPEVSLVEALAAMTDYRARLRTLFDRYEPSILATRPPSGDWSAIENAGHLRHVTGQVVRVPRASSKPVP
jgi:hypothetical protein